MLLLVDCDSVIKLQDSKEACNRALEIFSGFNKQNIKIRNKTLKRPWELKGLRKSTRRKKLY